MTLDKIKKIELEITSDCNAACPGCARTLHSDILQINQFGLNELKRLFPVDQIKDKQFKFCGVLGDPIANKECYEMVEYLATNGGWCQLSTNGGMNNAAWWQKLGKLSRETNNVNVHFCIDGFEETNHIYRVNTQFKIIKRNIEAYASESKDATWIYIVFDHNEHELPIAESYAKELGIHFATRTGMRNSYNDWIAKIKKRDSKTKKVVTEEKVISTTGKNEHKRKADVEKIDKYLNNETDNHEITKSIVCKYKHEGEIFIANDLTLWPCCFLWDSSFKNQEKINDKLNIASKWNSLEDKTIDEVLAHEWYVSLLEESWNPKHNLHLKRCVKSCALNKAYQNKIEYK